MLKGNRPSPDVTGMTAQSPIDGCMAWGGHGLLKVSPGLAMPDPSTPCGRAIPETALWPFQGWPEAVFYPVGYPASSAYGPLRPNIEGEEQNFYVLQVETLGNQDDRNDSIYYYEKCNFHSQI
jgi:hypothetical protein